MSSLQRRVGMLILIALVIHPLLVIGQGDITAVGSGIPAPLIQAFASEAGVSMNLSITGTNDGFAAFCRGEADLTTATRAISATEENDCSDNSVSFLELVIGYDITAVIANPATDFGQCLTTSQLDTLFVPSSVVSNWNEVSAENADVPLSLYVLADNTTPFALLDSVVEGVGLRSDLNTLDSDSAIVDAVASTPGALGVVHLPAALAAGDQVTILDLSTTTAGCASPSVDNTVGRTYQAAYPFYVYANSAALANTQPLLAAAVGADAAATVAAQGFVAPTEATYSTDADILANVMTGRQFSKEVTEFAIPTNLLGLINISGATTGSDYLTTVTGAFVQQYPAVTLNQTFTGEPDGIRQLCNGEVDMITAFHGLDPDQENNCAANNIPPETIHLGDEAIVLLGSGEFLTCLTTTEIGTVWSAASAGTITNWNQVNASFPDLPITLLGLPNSDSTGDVLMLLSSGENLPTREDLAESRTSPAYRATAVGNVEGGITYMNWLDYQRLTADVQASAQLIAVDGGSGCVVPSTESISDGSYPLARPLNLIVSRLAMARQEVQSLLWYLASDTNYSLLAANGFTGIPFAQLPDLRDWLQQTYAQAAVDAAAAAARAAEATPEVTPEATASS